MVEISEEINDAREERWLRYRRNATHIAFSHGHGHLLLGTIPQGNGGAVDESLLILVGRHLQGCTGTKCASCAELACALMTSDGGRDKCDGCSGNYRGERGGERRRGAGAGEEGRQGC